MTSLNPSLAWREHEVQPRPALDSPGSDEMPPVGGPYLPLKRSVKTSTLPSVSIKAPAIGPRESSGT